MFLFCCLYFLIFLSNVESACNNAPIDLNTATLSELDSLPYISSSAAELIINLRPICSPLELTTSPKTISGITENRLNNNWDWYSNQLCSDTCCKADASCSDNISPALNPFAIYSWQIGAWSDCSKQCNQGTQYRNITCFNSTHIVDNTLCLTLNNKPINKQLCNIQKCPIYEWIASEWSACNNTMNDNNECIQIRLVKCYEIISNTMSLDSMCDDTQKLDTTQSCNTCNKISNINTESTDINNDITVDIDLLYEYNEQQCHTDLYRNVANNTLITRRSCLVDIWVFIKGKTDDTPIDISWFYLNTTLQANINENVGDLWNNNYLSWYSHNTSSGWITITIPNNGNIGKFICNLYYKHNGIENNMQQISNFNLYILFNPYSSSDDDTYISSTINRKEYIENEIGLIWQGLSDNNNGFKWVYDQFNFNNLEISMNLLKRLQIEYRNNIVLISRHISYAVGEDICYGKWGTGSYTTGRPSNGYYCSKTKKNCRDPSTWTGTTPIFDLYRDVLHSSYSVQYCQCFVYAGIVTTVGRSLGIPTRPISTFQSAHDTDFNRGIEKYWIFDENSKVYEPTDDGESSDSIWSFHVWNEMYFKRNDFILDSITYNKRGWNAVDATPQEISFGGNPAITNDNGVYQMGPASINLVKNNKNPSQCLYASSNKERFGCFDNEFVISEVNANYNFWYKSSTDSSDTKFKLLDSFLSDPWGDNFGTIGQQISTKKPGDTISDDCLNEVLSDCSEELLDITSSYKNSEPSDPSTPTNTTNYYDTPGQQRNRRIRRRTLSWNDNGYNNNNNDSLDIEGIKYEINEIPNLYDLNSMIIADNKDDIIYLYEDDYTFGMIQIKIDSYFDDILYVYCSFIVTAHDYSGQQLYLNNNSINLTKVKTEKMNFMIDAGESDTCSFYVNYTEYEQWTDTEAFDGDISEIPYFFKFTLSVSIYDNNTINEPYKSIIEQRDILICSPIYSLRDRIICQNGLKWFEPSYNLDYECNDNNIDIDSIGDGFCDEINNIYGCYDGGDCCKSSCIASDEYFCQYFNCIDDRVNKENINYFKCHEPLSFVDYMDNLLNYSYCISIDESVTNFTCSHKIWTSNTGNLCIDYVSAANGVFGEIQNCYNDTFNSLQSEMQEIIYFVIDCMDKQQSLDNDTYTGLWNITYTPLWNITTTTTPTISTKIQTVTTTATTDVADIANFKTNICNLIVFLAFIFSICIY